MLTRSHLAASLATALLLTTTVVVSGCAESHEPPVTEGKDLRLAILHTTDIHSRLIPYDMQVLAGDRNLGLNPAAGPFGGVARMAHIIKRERSRADRAVYVDSGDCFQGAPIFNAFKGEIEQRALSLMRPDAAIIGNHEFDEGVRNYAKQIQAWASYPVLAANYQFEPNEPLGQYVKPVEIVNIDGLKIGFIGIANFSSIAAITDIGNSLGIVPLEIKQIVQDWIDVLEPNVDLIVGISHAGLTEDEEIIKATTGLDIIMGGHLHVVLMPPKVIEDASGRDVILAHSGAFVKFVGRLDVVVRDGDVIAHDYQVFPIDSSVPEDHEMVNLLEPYRYQLNQLIDLDSVYGYSSKLIRRFGFDGGDSPLGNLVAEGIRQYARADFGMTNSLGIRTDLNPGPINLDQLYNIFPFNNYVTSMYLSGDDVQALLDYVTLRSAGRGCATQIQVSGIEFVMDCRPESEECPDCPKARDIFFTACGDPSILDKSDCEKRPLQRDAVYELATNDYIAQGGSGFTVLRTNNTQTITDVALRDAVLERVIRSPLCVEECRRDDGSLLLDTCIGYQQCVEDLTAFYARRCAKVADVNPGETQVIADCTVSDAAACTAVSECYSDDCFGKGCFKCSKTADCNDGMQCFNGWCREPVMECRNRLCQRACTTNADCPGGSVLGGSGQDLCVAGVCHPRSGGSCSDDRSCIDAKAVCETGNCATCDQDAQCGGGELCIDGFCVVPVAVCDDLRCRPRCDADTDCLSGEVCNELGHCRPTACDEPRNLEFGCREFSQFRAMTTCQTLPCPVAEADGRISRILPANEDAVSDISPDDPL